MKLEYTVVLEPDQEGKGFTATVPALPGCVSEGDTLEEALENIKEAIELYLDSCQKAGEPIPVERIVPQISQVEVLI